MYVLDRLADTSFAWHMVEHLILLFVIPLLVLLARPLTIARAIAGKRMTASFVRKTRRLHVLGHPAVAFIFVTGYLWVLHFSPLYESALEHPLVHAGEHALLLAVGTLFWLPVLCPPPVRVQPYPARLLYLMLLLPQGALLAFAIDGARAPLYPHYAALMPGAVALADQRNGAALMWIGGGMIVFMAFLATFGAWAFYESAREFAEEAA